MQHTSNVSITGSSPVGGTKKKWPVRIEVSTSPFQGGDGGALPPRVTNFFHKI
jgi:hypothetical protein